MDLNLDQTIDIEIRISTFVETIQGAPDGPPFSIAMEGEFAGFVNEMSTTFLIKAFQCSRSNLNQLREGTLPLHRGGNLKLKISKLMQSEVLKNYLLNFDIRRSGAFNSNYQNGNYLCSTHARELPKLFKGHVQHNTNVKFKDFDKTKL